MKGILHSITRGPEPQSIEVSISIGDASPQSFLVSYTRIEREGNMSPSRRWDTGELLGFLTRLGNRGLVDNWFYEYEMMQLLWAFDRGETMPELPVELGTTRFWKPPGLFKILRNKVMRFFWRHGIFCKRLPSEKVGQSIFKREDL